MAATAVHRRLPVGAPVPPIAAAAEVASHPSAAAVNMWGVPKELRRNSPMVEVALLLTECIHHGVKAIAFCGSRKLCELVTSYTREALKRQCPDRCGGVGRAGGDREWCGCQLGGAT